MNRLDESRASRWRALSAGLVAAAALTGAAQAKPGVAADPFEVHVAAAKQAMMSDPQAALAEAVTAAGLAKAAAHRLATANWLQGEALLRLNRPADAAPVIAAGLAAIEAGPDTRLRGDLVMARAGVLATQGQVQAALQDYQRAFRIFAEAEEPRSEAIALQNIASIYQDAGDHAKVTQYFAQSAETFPGDPVLVLTAHNNMGRAYQAQGLLAQAITEFEKALAGARQMKSPMLQAHILTNLASAEIDQRRLHSAEQHLEQALAFTAMDSSAAEWRGSVRGVQAALELKRGRPRAAVARLEDTFAGMDLKQTSLVERDFHATAYQAYAQLGDSRNALAHLEAFKRLDDEARTVAASTNAALMAARFDFANQASRIAQLKAGQLQRDIKLARSRATITTVLAVGSVLLVLLLTAGLVSLRRSRNQVRTANRELSAANQALEKALAARTEFLATTSHEIRTPLNGILGMTQVILQDPRLDAGLEAKVRLVHGSGETMRALVDDLLDAAKIETGAVSIVRGNVDLKRLCEDTAATWADRAAERGLRLTVDLDDAPPRIVEDAARLRQILFNLLSNAIKFTHEGGIDVTVRAAPSNAGDILAISIADTGIGIAPEWQESVFEAFSQVEAGIARTYGGTGLGLSICRNLARAMGGDISLDSAAGRGSTFTLRLPLTRPDDEVEGRRVTAAWRLADCRVLVVDPNPLSQAVLRAVLLPQVKSVETFAETPPSAHDDPVPRSDLVVVDARALGASPEARLAALRALAARSRAIAVLAPAADSSEFAQLLASGAAQVIAKPIAGPALLDVLRQGPSDAARSVACVAA